MKNNILILIAFLIGFTSILNAQEIMPISKAAVLDKVNQDNTSLKISEQEFIEARADYRQTHATFLPNITVSHIGTATTNPLMGFGSKLNQAILTATDFDPAGLNHPSQVQSFATIFEIQQPIINMDGMYQRKAAKSKMDALALKAIRHHDHLVFEVEKAYMQLQLAYIGVDVLENALLAANDNKKLADHRFKQGYLQRADVLNVEVRVTEVQNQLQIAKSNILNASNYLSFLMNDENDVIYTPTDALAISKIAHKEENISENRSDIKAMQLGTIAFEAMNKADKMTFLPRLNAFGRYELYDNKLFQGDASGYLVGAQLSWDLFQGYKRLGKVQKSKAEFEKSTLEYHQYLSQSHLEFNRAKRTLTDAENKLKLTALALEQSKESLRIRTDRFKEGLEKTSDVLMAETQYAQKEMEYYLTIFEYNQALAYLQFLTKQ